MRQPTQQVIPRWPSPGRWWEGGEQTASGEPFDPRHLETPLDRLTRSTGGRRSETRTDRKRGRYVQSRPSPDDASDQSLEEFL